MTEDEDFAPIDPMELDRQAAGEHPPTQDLDVRDYNETRLAAEREQRKKYSKHGPEKQLKKLADNVDETAEAMAERIRVPVWKAKGILGDVAMMEFSRESQQQIADRWGVSFGAITTCRHMAKVTIDDVRDMMRTKSIMLANTSKDMLMDRISAQPSTFSNKELISIAKQMGDDALNWENKSVGGNTQTNIDIGSVQVLMQMQSERQNLGTTALERLKALGIKKDPEVIEVAQEEPKEEKSA